MWPLFPIYRPFFKLQWNELCRPPYWADKTGWQCFLCVSNAVSKSSYEQEMETVLLETQYNNLTKESDELQTSYNKIINDRQHLENKTEGPVTDQVQPTGWRERPTTWKTWSHYKATGMSQRSEKTVISTSQTAVSQTEITVDFFSWWWRHQTERII